MSAPKSWLQTLTGDTVVAARLSDTAQFNDMLRVEAAYTHACGAVGKIDATLAITAAQAIEAVTLDQTELVRRAAIDGVPVPALVDQIKAQLAKALHPAIHTGLTSQDVTDTALVLALRDILHDFETRIARLQDGFMRLQSSFGAGQMMGRTRMQAALPIEVSHRIAQWQAPWPDHLKRLSEMRTRVIKLQLGGPVGDGQSFDGFASALAQDMAQQLGLHLAPMSWHSRRDTYCELANWLSLVTGSLGKIGTDLALMAQQGIDDVVLKGGGSSSAMAHKSNPVRAEVLVALARDTAIQLSAMALTMEHENERSGAAWTLEWLVLPRMLENTGAALSTGTALLDNITQLGQPKGVKKL